MTFPWIAGLLRVGGAVRTTEPMTSLVRRAKYKPDAVDRWLSALLSRKPARVVTVALANKAARVIWAIMARGGIYRAPQPAGAGIA